MRFRFSDVLAFTIALAVSLTVIAHLSGYDRLAGPVLVVLAGLTLGLGILLRRLFAAQASAGKQTATLPMLVFCLVAAVGLYYVLPIRADVFPKGAELRVSAMGSASEATAAAEVWAKVVLPAGRVIKPKVVPAGWKLNDDGGVVATGATQHPVEWRIPLSAGAQLVLVRHPWSGRARVEWLGRQEEVSLHSPSDQSLTVRLDGRPQVRFRDMITTWAVATADVLTLALILLGGVMLTRAGLRRVK